MYKSFNLKIGGLLIPLLCALAVGLPQQAYSEPAKTVGELLFMAFDKNDMDAMRKIIKERTKEVPMEVMGMVKYALGPGASPEAQDAYFNLAGTIAQMYGAQTKDNRLLNAVQTNYKHVLELRKAKDLPPEAVDKSKSELTALGAGIWRVNIFELEDDGSLSVEIDVHDKAKNAFTPRIDMKTSKLAKEIVEKNLPNIKSGKISWSSMGVGLKTVLLGNN